MKEKAESIKSRCPAKAYGFALVEYITLILLVVVITVGLAMIIFSIFPSAKETLFNTLKFNWLKGLVVVTVGGFITLSVWSIKQSYNSIEHRARLAIIEKLSEGEEWKRNELKKEIRKESIMYSLFPTVFDNALSSLLNEGGVEIENGKYRDSKCPKSRILT